MAPEALTRVWATVNLAGLPQGALALVDAADEQMAQWIRDGILVRDDDERAAPPDGS